MGRELHGCNGGAIGATDDVGGSRAVSRRGNDFTYALYALSFDGVDDYVEIVATLLDGLNKATIEGWVYIRSGGVYQGLFGNRPYLNSSIGGLTLRITDGDDLELFLNGASGNAANLLNFSSYFNTWTHIKGRYDGSAIYIDINGSQVASAGESATINASNYFDIGRYKWEDQGNTYYSDSIISDVRCWAENHTTNDYDQRLTGNETGLVAYYPTDSGSGTTLVDNAGNNDGTINGATWVERSVFPTI